MVGHYADVARLVGLTENELYTQLKNIKQHANLSKFLKDSPYPSHFNVIQFKSRSMLDPTLSDIDFRNKIAWVWTTLESQSEIRPILTQFLR